MRISRTFLFIACMTAGACSASAHDIWLSPAIGAAGPAMTIHYGHPGREEAPAVGKLLRLSAVKSSGEVTDLIPAVAAANLAGAPVLTAPYQAGGGLVVVASFDNGFWTKSADGRYRNTNKLVAPEATASQWSMKYAKALVGPHPQFDRVVGQTLEIVPLADPAGTSQELRVRVLYRGEPLLGAEVKQRADDGQAHEREIVKTDANGIAAVRPDAGRQLVSVSHTVPSSQPTLADVDAHTATLTFDGNPALTQ